MKKVLNLIVFYFKKRELMLQTCFILNNDLGIFERYGECAPNTINNFFLIQKTGSLSRESQKKTRWIFAFYEGLEILFFHHFVYFKKTALIKHIRNQKHRKILKHFAKNSANRMRKGKSEHFVVCLNSKWQQ